MKVLVVLVLVVLTGCNARRLSADRQKPKLEVIVDFLWDLSMTNARAVTDFERDFKRTEIGKAVSESLKKVFHGAGEVSEAVWASLPPTTKAIIETSTEASFKLLSHVIRKVVDDHLEPMVKNEVEPLVQSAAPVMEEALVQLFEGSQLVQDTVSPYITEVMERVDPIFQNIQARLHTLRKPFDKTE